MSSDLEVLKRIVEAFEHSDWEEIDVRAGSLRIHLSARTDSSTAPVAPELPPSIDDPAPAAGQAEPPPAAQSPAGNIPAGAHLVVSPSPGIFWRSPQPGAPPFADTGDRVRPESTVCIVEVMKLMNHVKAAVSGTVAKVFLDDGVAVEQGDPLFAVTPDD